MKKFVLAVMAVAPCAALASYELLMYGAGSAGYVQRIDPVTGADLGRIGESYLQYAGNVILEGNTGNILVSDFATGRILRFNYSTGLFVNSFATGSTAYALTQLADGSIVCGTNGTAAIKRFSSTGTLLNSFNVAIAYSFVTLSNGAVLSIGFDNVLRRMDFATNSFTVEPLALTGTQAFGAAATGSTFAQINLTDIGKVQVAQSKVLGSYTNVASIDLLSPYGNVMVGRGLAFGHGEVLYATARDSTAGKNYLFTWDHNAGTFAFRRELPGSPEMSAQMAIVVAPEPASVLVLAGGMLAVLRFRRKS